MAYADTANTILLLFSVLSVQMLGCLIQQIHAFHRPTYCERVIFQLADMSRHSKDWFVLEIQRVHRYLRHRSIQAAQGMAEHVQIVIPLLATRPNRVQKQVSSANIRNSDAGKLLRNIIGVN